MYWLALIKRYGFFRLYALLRRSRRVLRAPRTQHWPVKQRTILVQQAARYEATKHGDGIISERDTQLIVLLALVREGL